MVLNGELYSYEVRSTPSVQAMTNYERVLSSYGTNSQSRNSRAKGKRWRSKGIVSYGLKTRMRVSSQSRPDGLDCLAGDHWPSRCL